MVGLLFPALAKIEYELPDSRGWKPGSAPKWLASTISQYLLGWLYAAGSITILVLSAIGPYKNADGSSRSVKGWYFPAITFSFLTFTFVYYCCFMASEMTTAVSMAGVNMHTCQHGVDDNQNVLRQCDFCVEYPRGEAHRHARDGYLNYNEYNFPEKDRGRNVLYWLFGGPKEQHYLDLHLDVYILKSIVAATNFFRGIWDGLRWMGTRRRRVS